MRRALLIGAVLLAGCGGGSPAEPEQGDGELMVERIDLRPGVMTLVVTNPTDEPAELSQVSVADGFVPYGGPARSVAPHTTVRLEIPYPWIAGQGYEVKVLTSDGDALEYELEPS